MPTTKLTIDPSCVLWSVEEAERTAALSERPLLVLLHGRGSNELDLFSLAPLLSPRSVVAAVRAPLTVMPGSYSWFGEGAMPGLPGRDDADRAVQALLEWLDTLPTPAELGLIGFSQGGAMAIHSLRHAPERFTAAVNLAGFVIPGDQLADASLETLRPPVFWGRDVADPIIPASAISATAAWLPGHSSLTTRLYPGIGHSVSRQEIDDVNEFLGLHLSGL